MHNKPSYFITADVANEIASTYEKQLKEIFTTIKALSESGKFEMPYFQEITENNKESIISNGFEIIYLTQENPAFSSGAKYMIKWNK